MAMACTLRIVGPVAQSGQSSGLIIRWLQVQVLPGPQTTYQGFARGGETALGNGKSPGQLVRPGTLLEDLNAQRVLINAIARGVV